MNSIVILLGSFIALITLRVPIAFAIGVSSLLTVLTLGLPPTSVVNQMV
ncbi:hypothetical protein [Roseinatronobacter sp. S2]|nr:hypothetical protein [Roseinatronobacter sp. S2]WFE77086.1 hypothetical protein P8S53_19765 [Roseinatronobacter sp. S2]